MKIIVKKEFKFGSERIYPVCENAKIFCKISNGKILIPRILELIKELGYEVEHE